jgi:hypothetical protein
VSRLENRLRDAYRGEADAVTPASIVSLGEAIADQARRPARLGSAHRHGPARRWSRWLAPLAAASAVAVIAITATMVVPRGASESQPPTAPPAAPKFLIEDSTGTTSLQVRNASTGTFVAKVTVPQDHPGKESHAYITGVTTNNGRDYLVAEYSTSCRSSIYQFSLDSAGRPSAVTPFRALPTVQSHLYGLTISGNGQLVGFITNACQDTKPQPNYFGVTNIRTRHTTRWTAPAGSLLDTVSLTADGKQLCYNVRADGSPSLVRVIPTVAAPGRAADIGRTVAEAPSGRSIFFAAISADGGKVYFSSLKEPVGNPPWSWASQIREVNLVTGQSRLVYAPAGKPDPIASDPAVRSLLLQIRGKDAERIARLVRLDLATGKATDLPAGKFRLPALLYW